MTKEQRIEKIQNFLVKRLVDNGMYVVFIDGLLENKSVTNKSHTTISEKELIASHIESSEFRTVSSAVFWFAEDNPGDWIELDHDFRELYAKVMDKELITF